MDQLSSLYVRMVSGVHSQLHNSASVMGFVDQMQSRMEKSSAPRKNYLIDPSTPHSDTVIAESSALKPSVGWVTLLVTEGIRSGIHEWGIKVEHHGESNDGSGLMLGIAPKNFTKHDTFISQGGGWCLSRAGKFYGHWRRTDTSGGVLTFGTGDRVVLTLDYDAAVMTVRVGEKMVVGELSGLTMEVFPAISLHYRHQHVRFDYHAVRETAAQHQPWLQRQAFPFAPAFMNLSVATMQKLPLDSYLFSTLFQQYTSLESSSATTMEGVESGGEGAHFAASSAAEKDASLVKSESVPASTSSTILVTTRHAEQRAMRLYSSSEAAAARLTVLSRAFAAVRRYVAVVPRKSRFLAPHVTAEYLRQRVYSVAREYNYSSGGGGGAGEAPPGSLMMDGHGGSPHFSGSTAYDAILNCGAVIVAHLFIRAVSGGQEVAAPLVHSFRDYLLSLPMFSLVEYDGSAAAGGSGTSRGRGSVRGGSSVGARSALAPETVQLAVDHVLQLIESALDPSEASTEKKLKVHPGNSTHDLSVTPLTASLMEVALLLALQRGLVSEVLRISRLFLRVPSTLISPPVVQWLNRYATELTPQQALPDVGRALKRACEDPSSFALTPIDPAVAVLSVAYGLGATLFVHTGEALTKYGPSAASPYVFLAETKQPAALCTGSAYSTLAVTHTRVLLLTDRMAADETALVMYSLQLDAHQILRWADMHSSWPRTLTASPQLVTTTEDLVLVVFDNRPHTQPLRVVNGAAAAAGMSTTAAANSTTARGFTSPIAAPATSPSAAVDCAVMVHCYNAATTASLTAAPLWTRPLHPAASSTGLCLSRCLGLRKPSLIDLGSPEQHLTVAGGQVTVEMWVQFLDKEDAATLYQHGDRSTNGEVFLELIKSEGTHCIHGGYRHETRGSCLVSAPLPPTAESRPFHIALVFNGRWRLFFEGEQVAGNRQGPHVSLDAPKQRWTVGSNCTCLLTGLRVWRLGRTAREISRDFRRSLTGDEPGLVTQFFFNERSGNVVLNYVHNVKACHAVCSGAVTHVACDSHPWRSYGSPATAASMASTSRAEAPGTLPAISSLPEASPMCARLHEWRDLALSTCCATQHTLILSTPVGNSGPYALREGGHVLMFFDLATGVAHRSLFFLTSRSPVRHMMRADPLGRLWELFEVDAGLVKGEREASYLLSLLGTPGTAPQRPRERVIATASLPLMEDEDNLDSIDGFHDQEENEEAENSSEETPEPSRQSESASPPLTSLEEEPAAPGLSASIESQAIQTLSRISSFTALIAQPSAAVPYGAVAVWLLKLLALHAEAEFDIDQVLFSPLADDVGARCVAEVRLILNEHFRVVKSSNARRAVALRSSVSWVVVAAALRVLLRLVRRARAFGLHPTPLGLTVVKEGTEYDSVDAANGSQSSTSVSSSKATMALLLRELRASSIRRRASSAGGRPSRVQLGRPGSDCGDDADAPRLGYGSDSSTQLGLLGDIINEEGLTLSADIVGLARLTTVEGVELFLPDVRHRARLLRDLLRASSLSAGAVSSVQNVTAAAEERVPALEVLLDAVAQSFTTVLAAAPLLSADQGEDDAAAGNIGPLTELKETLCTLLEESSIQWRRLWMTGSTLRYNRKFGAFATSLSEAVASLQLLLLGACQGSRWEVALAQMYASVSAGLGTDRRTSDTTVEGARGGITFSANGSIGVGLGGVSGAGGPESVSATALDMQQLCFSQATAYHPCVRAYYGALFGSTESCLSLCVQVAQRRTPSVRGDTGNGRGASVKAAATLPSMLSSLAPTFVNVALHTALSAIPLVLAAEDAGWFLEQLEHLLGICETLLEHLDEFTRSSSSTDVFSSTGGGALCTSSNSTAVARRLVCSLREALFYASVWAAAFLVNSSAVSSASVKTDVVRRRLGLMSVTTTPKTQRQAAQLTGNVPSGAKGTTMHADVPSSEVDAETRSGTSADTLEIDAELARIWEHPLLEAGCWHSPPIPGCAERRDQFVARLVKNSAYWESKQTRADPLLAKSHPAMGSLITAMAAAALHLSPIPIQALPATRLEELMCSVMRKLTRPVCTELLSRREENENGVNDGEGRNHPLTYFSPCGLSKEEAFSQKLAELHCRCEILLRMRTCSELSPLDDPLFALPSPNTATVTARAPEKRGTSRGSLMATTVAARAPPRASRWKSAVQKAYKLQRLRSRAHVASHPSWTLQEAVQLVSRVVLSRSTTAESLRTALRQREELAVLRETGIQHLFQLVLRAPYCAECVAQLLSASGRGSRTHFEEGIGGSGEERVRRIRRELFRLIRWAVDQIPVRPHFSGGNASNARSSAAGPLSLTSSATVLCDLLDRNWRPRDMAFFLRLRIAPVLVETYVSLFTVSPPANGEAGSDGANHVRGSGGDGEGSFIGRQRSAIHSGATDLHNGTAEGTGGVMKCSGSSLELRRVHHVERRHRDQIIAAQQARRTSKNVLVSAHILGSANSASGSPEVTGSGNSEAVLHHTATEAMQARVWLCLKNLALQSTAMLTPERFIQLSRVEQMSVMAFLASLLSAIETELEQCLEVLARAVEDTPALLAQVADTAVLEPLIIVKDQVDTLCSVLTVVAGTLCTATAPSSSTSSAGDVGAASDSAAVHAGEKGGATTGEVSSALFLSSGLSHVCASLGETLLGLVFLDLRHAAGVRAEAGVGGVVRDAAACARIAALLLCRCPPSSLREKLTTSAVWKEMRDSPVFRVEPQRATFSEGHPYLRLWLDVSVYALATSGMSRTTQHVLLAFRRILQQPSWSTELRGFASAYEQLVRAFAAATLCSDIRERAREATGLGEKAKPMTVAEASCSPSDTTLTPLMTRIREFHAIQLYVWTVLLGGQLLAPPTLPGASVEFLDERDGYHSTHAYVVDVDTTISSLVNGGNPTGASTTASSGASCGRHGRGSSHFLSKTAAAVAADGEKVRGVIVVPTDLRGLSDGEETQLSQDQVFQSGWEDAVMGPSYPGLVQEFLVPALQHCVPLLGEKLSVAAPLSGLELVFLISLLHLVTGLMRARPDLARQLIETGALKTVREYALQGTVRLPFPLKTLRELGALVAARAAEVAAERISFSADPVADSSVTAPQGTATVSPLVVRAASSPLSAVLGGASAAAGGRTGASGPPGPHLVAPGGLFHPSSPGMSEALLESFRGVSPGLLSNYAATYHSSLLSRAGTSPLSVSNPLPGTSISAFANASPIPSSSGFLRDTNEFGLSRLARTLGVLSGACSGGSVLGGGTSSPQMRGAGMAMTGLLNGSSSGLATTRVPPRTELGNGAPMFLAFPLWSPADSTHPCSTVVDPQNYSPAALEITPSRATGYFPVWEDGFAIELVVLLSDGNVYPAIGDALCVPFSWPAEARDDSPSSPHEFPLCTLYAPTRVAGDNASNIDLFPFLQLNVREGSLNVVVSLPRRADNVEEDEEDDGTPSPLPFMRCTAKRTLRREDWHHCIHVSVMCSTQSLALSRNGDMTTVEWGGVTGIGRHVEEFLRQKGAIQKVVLGRLASATSTVAPQSASSPPLGVRETDGPMVLIGGLRIWSTSVLRASLRVVAEFVVRDHVLQSVGPQENVCYFDLKEGSGAIVESADAEKLFRGRLSGMVRWAVEPLPLGFYPSIELNSGNVHDGVTAPMASRAQMPRAAMRTFIDALSPFYFERFGGDVLRSLLTLSARCATVMALEVGTSPAYALSQFSTTYSSPRESVAASSPAPFDPREVLDVRQKIPHQLLRLFQFHDGGFLSNAHERLIHTTMQQLVTVLAVENPDAQSGARHSGSYDGTASVLYPSSTLCELVADAALLLRQLRRDDSEIFVMELPPPSSVTAGSGLSTTSSPTSSLPSPLVLPLAFTNGGTGILTFDAKYRNMEQATVYKDVELRNAIAKYPDGQGGWPMLIVNAAETPWVYLRSVPTSTTQRISADGKSGGAVTMPSSSILTVTTKSLKPAILHAMVKAICTALKELLSTARKERDGQQETIIAEQASACLLDARVMSTLIQQCSARSSEDDCVHFVQILTAVLRLWQIMPHVQPHDQMPLAMAMSHLNVPLCSIIQHVNSDSDFSSLISSVTGTYSPYVQSLLGLLVGAVQTDCAWAGRSYVRQLQGRWRRLWGMWSRAAVYRPSEFTDGERQKKRTATKSLTSSSGKNGASTKATSKKEKTTGMITADAVSSAFRTLFFAPPPTASERAGLQPVARGAVSPDGDSLDTSVTTAGASTIVGYSSTEALKPECGQQFSGCSASSVPNGTPVHLGNSRGDQQPCTLCAVGLVAMRPPKFFETPAEGISASTSQAHENCTDRATLQTQRNSPRNLPAEVSRKGNGLWVVRASGAGGFKETADELNPFTQRDGGPKGVVTVRSSVGFTSGAFYWEVYVANIGRTEHASQAIGGGMKLTSNIVLGVATERCVPPQNTAMIPGLHAEPRDGFLGTDGESWGFDGGRSLRLCRGYAVESNPRARWKTDDIIGVVLDLRQNKLSFLHNGRIISEFSDNFLSDDQCAAGLAVFPVITCTGDATCEVNFGVTGFATPPPPGCLPVDLSIYVGEEACRSWKVVLAEEVCPPAVNPSRPAENVTLMGLTEGACLSQRRLDRTFYHPVIPFLCRHLTRYTCGRQGPLDVMLLCPDTQAKLIHSRECKTDNTASLVLASVAVTSGKWYFEVVVPAAPTFSIGWYACKSVEGQGSERRISAAGRMGGVLGGGEDQGGNTVASPLSGARMQLGTDDASWAFDAARMMARHGKQQQSLLGRAWKCGDVVGCLLDCDAGTVSYSVNGEYLKMASGIGASSGPRGSGSASGGLGGPFASSGAFETVGIGNIIQQAVTPASSHPTVFSGVDVLEAQGLIPAILLEPKSSLVCLWNEEEFLYPPANAGDIRAIGGSCAVRRALVDLVTTREECDERGGAMWKGEAVTDSHGTPAQTFEATPLNAAALQKMLHYASKVQRLHPASLRSYTLPSLFAALQDSPSGKRRPVEDAARTHGPHDDSIRAAPTHRQGQRDLCTACGLGAEELLPHLIVLLFLGHLTTLLYPFAQPATLPVSVENTPQGSSWALSKLQETLHSCKLYAPPWMSLRLLQCTLDASNGAGDAVRLSVNRRKALTMARDGSASAQRRLRDSLFGQVYQLLSSKPPAFFTTKKKLWTVSFYGEGADDVGGPYRECLSQMCTELMSPTLHLFLPSANMANEMGDARDRYVLNPQCLPPLEIHMYRFLGRLMGGCLRGGEPLSLYLPSVLWKYLVGDVADESDIARYDIGAVNALHYVEQLAGVSPVGVETGLSARISSPDKDAEINEELAELFPDGFSALNDAGIVEELVPGGTHIAVTATNAALYTRLVREHKLYGTGAAQRRALQQGFHEVVPLFSVSALKWYELEELVCGQCDYDPDALLDSARYEGMASTDVRVGFLRRVLRDFTRHQRALFMRFVSGRERLPPGMYLTIMPDDTPRNVAALPHMTSPRAQTSNSVASRDQQLRDSSAVPSGPTPMTPQPPPGSEQRNSSSFVRYGTFAQSHAGGPTETAALLSSPPQIDFTPPPAPATSRLLPPPALQPSHLHPIQHNVNSALLRSLPNARGMAPPGLGGGDVAEEDTSDPALCDDVRLPHASTCFYWLRLPRYSSASVMAEKLLFAIEQCLDIDADFRVHDSDVVQQEVGPSLARVSSDEDDLFEDFSHLR